MADAGAQKESTNLRDERVSESPPVPELSAEELANRKQQLVAGGWVLNGFGGVSAIGALFAFTEYMRTEENDTNPPWNLISMGLAITSGLLSVIGTLMLLER